MVPGGAFVKENPEEANVEMARLQDQIAWSVWEDYQQILLERGIEAVWLLPKRRRREEELTWVVGTER